MPTRIEDYGLIGDCETAALVSRDGSIDWLCFPRFDSPACFAALLGTPDHGRWLLQPRGVIRELRRRYRQDTLILETDFETDDGGVRLIDFMPLRDQRPDLVRIVVGRHGRVPMTLDLVIRFDYGGLIPWVRNVDGGLSAIAGPDALHLRSPVPLRGQNFRTLGEFEVSEGQRLAFVLTWSASHESPPSQADPEASLQRTEDWWQQWANQCTYQGPWREAVVRSLMTLKGLTYAPTGGIVAAPTTSLPETLGGSRNWDYRFCWLRDATFILYALMRVGYMQEARNWRDWLLRAVAGEPSQVQMLYGIAGERRLTELEIPWLPGYENSTPVRIGNAAYHQFQLDVYGEVMAALHLARNKGLQPDENAWRVQRAMLKRLEDLWQKPDESLWEVRGQSRHFTHSKVMAWVAVDRAVRSAERFGLSGHLDHWKRLRAQIHAEVCEKGFDRQRNSFVQSFGSQELDASLLMIPLVHFLPATDPRVQGTIEAIEKDLTVDGLVRRYNTETGIDGLTEGEGTFLLCTFWLADNLALSGRVDEARELFGRLLDLRNDLGLLAEEYDPRTERFLGNFPQAFSHMGLINTAKSLGPSNSLSDAEES